MNITVNGARIEAEWHGAPPDQAPTLVLLHEGHGDFAGALARPINH